MSRPSVTRAAFSAPEGGTSGGAPRRVASMTGFGRSKREADDDVFDVELRAVNNRFLKVQPRLSDAVAPLAAQIEQRVRDRIARGTINVTVRHVRKSGAAKWRIDEGLLRRYVATLATLQRELGGEPFSLAQVALLPGVVSDRDALDDDQDALWERLVPGLDAAIAGLVTMRQEEGAGIARDLEAVVERILGLATKVEGRIDGALDDYKRKLRARIEKLLQGTGIEHPEADLSRELALFADRSDISEELQRLRSHCTQVRETLRNPAEAVGRKLEFLAQELLREANTMASKSHDTSLVAHVLEIKLEVERVREQVANLE